MTFLDRKPFIYVWGPVYRALFEGIVWPFLARLKGFFLADISADLTQLKQTNTASLTERLSALEAENRVLRQQTDAILARVAAMDAENAKQWESLSKLLLCLYQQPRVHSGGVDSRRADTPISLSRAAS